MPASTPTLRDMIQDALDHGRTYEQLEKDAIDPQTSKRVSRAMINNIARDEVGRMPYDYHLRAIAAALRQPYETVRRAAIAQWLPSDDATTDTSALLAAAQRLETEARRLTEIAERQAGESGGERETA